MDALNKKCERCGEPIPDDYVNLLCDQCYLKLSEEIEAKKLADKEAMTHEAKKNPMSAINNTAPTEPVKDGVVDLKLGTIVPDPRFGIKDPNYRENPEADDKDQILANLAQFIYSHDPAKKRTGKMLWYPQRNMYTFIKNYMMKKVLAHPQYPKYLWKPDVVDVGCGSGVGANILSQEANFVWGIDKNDFSLEFAKECFTREKNGLYYSGQVTFDNFDIVNDTRQTMKFDTVVAIEVLEHVYDTDKFLRGMIRFTKRDKHGRPVGGAVANVPAILEKNGVETPREKIEPTYINSFKYGATEFFISSPNRNFHKIRKDRPENPYHCREWSSQELTELLRIYFENVEIMNQKGEPVAEDTLVDEVIFFKCSVPKI